MESEKGEQKNIEREYIESTLLGIQALKNNLVTQIAHNFRTPLSSVIGFAEMLTDDRPLTDEQRVEYARFIQYEGIRLSKLIDDLIELSSLERECTPIPMCECILQEVVSEAIGRVAGFARGRLVTIHANFPAEPLCACLHSEKIVQAVYQLLHNAVRISKSHGDVQVCARNVDGTVEISIRDSGPGIQEKDIPALAERFGNTYRPEQDPYGTGVGLAIVRHITDLHRGTIRVENNPGEGSTVTIRLRPIQE